MTKAARHLETMASGSQVRAPPLDVGGILGHGPAVGPGMRGMAPEQGVRLDPDSWVAILV